MKPSHGSYCTMHYSAACTCEALLVMLQQFGCFCRVCDCRHCTAAVVSGCMQSHWHTADNGLTTRRAGIVQLFQLNSQGMFVCRRAFPIWILSWISSWPTWLPVPYSSSSSSCCETWKSRVMAEGQPQTVTSLEMDFPLRRLLRIMTQKVSTLLTAVLLTLTCGAKAI